jgi:chromosome segregation ATPase
MRQLKKQVGDLTEKNTALGERVADFNNRDKYKVCQCHMDAVDSDDTKLSYAELETVMKRYKAEKCQLQCKVQVLEQQAEDTTVDLVELRAEKAQFERRVNGLESRLQYGEPDIGSLSLTSDFKAMLEGRNTNVNK